MKNPFILVQVIGLALLISFSSCKQGSNTGGKNGGPYGVKSGIITYKPMNMMGMSITQTIYFDDYGNREARELVTQGNMMGKEIKSHVIDIRDGLTNIHYELENIVDGQNVAKKEAYKQEIPIEMLEQQNFTNLSDEMKKKMKYKEEGTETVAGLKGTKYSMAPDSANPTVMATGVHYKNIPLKISMGGIEIIADKVDFDAKVPAEKFKVPEGYTVVDQKNQGAPIEIPGQEEKK